MSPLISVLNYNLTISRVYFSGVTIGPADPALQGGAVFGGRQNSTLATADGQKNFRRYIKPDLATVDGQKIIGVYNKPDLATVDGQKKL